MKILLLPVLLLVAHSTLIRPLKLQKAFTVEDVKRTLNAIEKLLKYFDKNRGSMIVDSMWGVRMIEGGLLDAVTRADASNTPELVAKVLALSKYAKEVAERGLFYAKRNAAVQFAKFSQLLSGSFVYQNLVGGTITKINPSLAFAQRSRLNIQPKESDDCLMGTIGSGHYQGSKCTITDKCWSQITDKGQKEYSITHQLLFFFLLKHYNCTQAIESRGGQQKVREVAIMFCTNIYLEMEEIFERGVDPGVDQDLVMEQIMFCGGAGFVEEFIRPDIGELLLDWQRDDGCYAPYDGSHLPEAIELHSKRSRERARQRLQIAQMNNQVFEQEQNVFLKRKPLSEAELRDGCMMHMSSVAGGALTIYIRALLQYKLYTDHRPSLTPYNIADQSQAHVFVIGFLCLLTVLVLCRTCWSPTKCFIRIMSRLRFNGNGARFMV